MNRQNICLRGWYDNDDTIYVWVKKIHSYWYQPMWHMINSEMHIRCAFKFLSVLLWSWNIRVDSVCLKSVWSRKHFHRTFILEMIWIVCSWWYFKYRQTKQNYNVFLHWKKWLWNDKRKIARSVHYWWPKLPTQRASNVETAMTS